MQILHLEAFFWCCFLSILKCKNYSWLMGHTKTGGRSVWSIGHNVPTFDRNTRPQKIQAELKNFLPLIQLALDKALPFHCSQTQVEGSAGVPISSKSTPHLE
jgi:hypothetical protein